MEKRFYENSKFSSCENLLKATPYSKETTVNFDNGIDPNFFFEKLYQKRSFNDVYKIENDNFDQKMNNILIDSENRFSKINIIHIAGYAGCGKTTYIHHLMRDKKIGIYDVIDYEKCVYASEPFIEHISHLLANSSMQSRHIKDDVLDFFDKVMNRQFLNINQFDVLLPLLNDYLKQLNKTYRSGQKKNFYRGQLEKIRSDYEINHKNSKKSKVDFLSFLMLFEFIMLLFKRFHQESNMPMVLVIDNADSLDNLSEESVLLQALKSFFSKCNSFFGKNIDNEETYNNKTVADVLKETKLTIFFTTRMSTATKYDVLEPDLERMMGWFTIKFPEHYYDHKEIIDHRLKYYLQLEKQYSVKTELSKKLEQVCNLSGIAYANNNFMRLFNGNYRACVEKICEIIRDVPLSIINELNQLFYGHDKDLVNVKEGANGYFLSLILSVFKKDGVYSEALKLSEYQNNNSVSLSRIILTILREKGDRCSTLNLFDLLVPLGYNPKIICEQIWALCEISRDCGWRRLLLFDVIVPESLEEYQKQEDLYAENVRDINKYTELVTCTAGRAYMEFVLPHFEFMLSRIDLDDTESYLKKYLPLYSSSSLELIGSKENIPQYRFDKKIGLVYNKVITCANNSVNFAKKAEHEFGISSERYINGTFFNYQPYGRNSVKEPKQSYESRLIFRHITYIDKYRQYLVSNESIPNDLRVSYNKNLVDWIIKYLDLYDDPLHCYQTEAQNNAAKELRDLANKIVNSGYTDFATRIER